ncbi:Fur family transcriptional regulator [Catalinimonas niigatensis]|uniref:Fur family transcriptional regulator n=1 Tax=Catalinimonas niigatensis TaxID=1397264 RepID=UPI002666A18D|nr:transcriptional repressor [Catalinimonas niigatensis]WPP51190.1 transcriptional repressor [Catalinimonas niigatensis]
MNQDKIENLLQQHQLRITKCRTDIILFFLEASFALSAKDLENKFPQYDRVTIYRTLHSFIEKNMIHPIPSDGGAALYGLSDSIRKSSNEEDSQQHSPLMEPLEVSLTGLHHDEHIHFSCHACGRTLCLPEQTIPKVNLPQGYQVREVEMVVKGYCKSCSPS